MKKEAFGLAAEEQAAEHLERTHGWKVLGRRVRFKEGEIDLIMERGPEEMASGHAPLVFVEVKGRRSFSFGAAVESVTVEKVRRIRRAVGRWRAESGDFREGELLLVTMEWREGKLTIEEIPME